MKTLFWPYMQLVNRDRYTTICEHWIAQDLLSTNTLAPKVILHEKLPGGWHAVIMEKVDGALPLADLDDETTKSSLKSAVDILHSSGMFTVICAPKIF